MADSCELSALGNKRNQEGSYIYIKNTHSQGQDELRKREKNKPSGTHKAQHQTNINTRHIPKETKNINYATPTLQITNMSGVKHQHETDT
jgi:hypothetical protein